ncbi:AAA family ATPase [Endozoicomonas acroporae]|uniref:AAA family ATPase n=1 Tax=Endozoicomonas acroporae TaxID=1701104 RepID=UPI003D78D0E0
MKLSHLKLTNFRCYQDLEIDLHPQVTVLVAENGQGKTTLLDAIRIALWPYVSSFDLARSAYADPANTIVIDDIHLALNNSKMARQLPCSIEVSGDYGEGESTWMRFRDSEAKKSQTKDDKSTRELKSWAKSQQKTVRDVEKYIDLPVFGYYGTGRLWKEKRLTKDKVNKTETINQAINTFAYRDCLDPASSYRHFEDWFTLTYIMIREYQIEQLESGASEITGPPDLMQKLEVIRSTTNQLLSETGWSDLTYSERDNKSLVLFHKAHGALKVSQLSDGIKNMVAMVADIAYRCCHLNPHLGHEAALKAEGIVLIDEVDMHLHPKWQQTVIQGLTTAFPNIQFIVTTHSPQVLSTVKAESIRLLKHTVDPQSGLSISEAIQPKAQCRGVASSDLMADLMGVDPIPDVIEAGWLSSYKALIQQNRHDTDTGKELRALLEKHFGLAHQELLECNRLIRIQEFKSKLPKQAS